MSKDSYNGMGMVSPEGVFHSTEGLSHPDWCHRHRDLVGFVGVKNADYEPAISDAAISDIEGCIAFDHFMREGWIRVKPDVGIEIGGIDGHNRWLVKRILRDIAEENRGRSIHVDDGEGTKRVCMSVEGQMDWSDLEQRAVKSRLHRY